MLFRSLSFHTKSFRRWVEQKDNDSKTLLKLVGVNHIRPRGFFTNPRSRPQHRAMGVYQFSVRLTDTGQTYTITSHELADEQCTCPTILVGRGAMKCNKWEYVEMADGRYAIRGGEEFAPTLDSTTEIGIRKVPQEETGQRQPPPTDKYARRKITEEDLLDNIRHIVGEETHDAIHEMIMGERRRQYDEAYDLEDKMRTAMRDCRPRFGYIRRFLQVDGRDAPKPLLQTLYTWLYWETGLDSGSQDPLTETYTAIDIVRRRRMYEMALGLLEYLRANVLFIADNPAPSHPPAQ